MSRSPVTLLFVILFAISALTQSVHAAVEVTKPVETPTPQQAAQIADLTRQAEDARYAKDIAEIKATILQSQTSWFESLISILGVLITVLMLYFSFRFGREAVAEAKLAATQGLEAERKEIQTLLDQAKAAVAQIHETRETAMELLKDMKPGEAPTDPGTKKQIGELAAEATAKPRRERTVEDYRALAIDAFVNKNWAEMERQAAAMEYFLEGELDDEGLAFALFNRAYALRELERREEAGAAYGALVDRFRETDTPELRKSVEMALNNWGNALSDQAKDKQGEAADALYAQAGEKFAAALAIKPDNHEALSNWGNALLEQAKTKQGEAADALYAQAGEKYAAALAIKPDNHAALYNWGAALLEQAKTKQGEAADALFAQAQEKLLAGEAILPGSCFYNLACLAGLQGDAAGAAQWLEQSKRLGVRWLGCERVLAEADFASVRDTPQFQAALAAVGCV